MGAACCEALASPSVPPGSLLLVEAKTRWDLVLRDKHACGRAARRKGRSVGGMV